MISSSAVALSLHGGSALAPVIVRPTCILPRCTHLTAVLAFDDDDDDDDDDSVEFEADEEYLDELERELSGGVSSGRRVRSSRPRPDAAGRVRLARVLDGSRTLAGELKSFYDDFTASPSSQLVLGSLALLVGFFVSHGQVLGGGDQGGRWEYVSGAFATVVVERITRGYYDVPFDERSPTMKLLNAFKVGFFYGAVLDALKFGG